MLLEKTENIKNANVKRFKKTFVQFKIEKEKENFFPFMTVSLGVDDCEHN